jgi:3-oxoacyl-[acyl-carrier protein] reductase
MAMATMASDVAGPIVGLLDPVMRSVTGEVTLIDAGGHLDVALSRRPGKEH